MTLPPAFATLATLLAALLAFLYKCYFLALAIFLANLKALLYPLTNDFLVDLLVNNLDPLYFLISLAVFL